MKESNRILNVKLLGGHVLVARELEFQLFIMPVWSHEQLAFKSPCALAASLRWDTPASDAVIIYRLCPQSDILSSVCPWPEGAVTILIRESSEGFHTIRQYDLLPNVEGKLASGHPLVLPCIIPSTYTRIIPVVPSCCKLTAGRGGKGFWIQTDNTESNHKKYPARCFMGFDVLGPKTVGNVPNLPCLHPRSPLDEHDSSSTSNDLHLCAGPIYTRRCAMTEIVKKTYSLRAVDIEDVLGRIVVGDKTGKIEVLDYVS